jgi:hypothetical protein
VRHFVSHGKGVLWTAEEDRKLLGLDQQGLKLAVIVKEMENRKYDSVTNRLRNLKCGSSDSQQACPMVHQERLHITGETSARPFSGRNRKKMPGRSYRTLVERCQDLAIDFKAINRKAF